MRGAIAGVGHRHSHRGLPCSEAPARACSSSAMGGSTIQMGWARKQPRSVPFPRDSRRCRLSQWAQRGREGIAHGPEQTCRNSGTLIDAGGHPVKADNTLGKCLGLAFTSNGKA